jgi:glycosyltransferase involved in cell wall biosynthesis
MVQQLASNALGRSSMRVALILPTLEVGGQERLAVALASRLGAQGIVVEVVALVEGGALEADLAAAGVPTTVLRPRPHAPGYPAALLAHLRQRRPDVLHSHSGSWFPAAVAGRLLGIPVLHVEHGRYPDEPWWSRWADRAAARLTTRIVVVSDLLRRDMREHLRLDVLPELIRNGVAIPPLLDDAKRTALRARIGLDADTPVVGTVGRLVEVKQHGLLLRAMAGVRQRVPRARLVIIGDGPLRGALQQAASIPELEGFVTFPGARADAAELVGGFDVYVSSSSTEGTPLAVLEAMAAGVAVVATDVGGLGAVLDGGAAGALVPPGDEAALAAEIAEVLTDPARRAALASAGRARVERDYGVDACARRYAALYDDLRARRRSTGGT